MERKPRRKNIFNFFIIIILYLFLCGCQENINLNPAKIRLAVDYNSDWGKEAIGELNFELPGNHIKIAVIDTGCNIDSTQIIEKYNVTLNNENVSDKNGHGDMIVQKLLDINDNANVYIIKITDDSESINEESLSMGIYKAIEFGVDVINISLGTSQDYDMVREAIEKAYEEEIAVVVSAGNVGEDLLYPAKYDGVISVMARDINNLDIISNSKSKSKRSFSAPGEHILVDDEYVTGTSIAAVYITNAISYIKSQKPDIKYNDIVKILEKSCDYPTEYSYGMINYKKLIDLKS